MKFRSLKIAAVSLLAVAGVSGQNKPSAREVDSFRLTMPGIKATMAAYGNLVQLLESDPALAEKYKAARKTLPDTNGRDTLSLTAQKLQASEPRIAAAFSQAGISAKDAGMHMETLMGVILGDGLLEASKTNAASLPPMVMENLTFYRQNKAAVMAEFQRFSALASKSKKVLSEEDSDEDEKDEEDEKEPQR